MTRANFISILLIVFLVVIFMLSTIGIINISYAEIFYFILVTAGFALSHLGIIKKIDLIIFLGTCIFLVGILLITRLHFLVELNNTAYLPVISSIATVGFLMMYISGLKKKFFLFVSIILLVATSLLIITTTRFEIKSFFSSILPLLNVFWPVIIIVIILVILLKENNEK